MSAGKTYLKCKCPHCGAEVSYPDYAGGGASACGKCAKTVLLPRAAAAPPPAPVAVVPTKPVTPPASAPKIPSSPAPKTPPAGVKRVEPSAIRPAGTVGARSPRSAFLRVCLWTLNIAIVLAVVIVLGNHVRNRPASSEGEKSVPLPSAPVPAAKQAPPSAPPAASPPANPVPAMTTPKGPKLLDDLKVTQVALEQPKGAKGSRLVYVTGLLKNDSDHQRFGVRVELELLDAATNKVGTATDYRQMLDPRASWQFRAIVTDRRATAAKLVGVKEDE